MKTNLNLQKVDRIEKIIHIGDIHIRQLERHKEYKEIFDKLFEEVKETKEKHPNTVVYIAGDIVHSKLDITSEMFDMVQYFLKNLAYITDVLVLIGNHDLNVKNKDRLDIITAAFKHLDMKNIHILKYGGLYYTQNIVFSVMSVLDNPEDYIFPKHFEDENRKKVAIFHGIVDGSANEHIHLKNNSITAGMFDGFDFAMLGDVHKYQDLGSKNKLNTPIVYCSSLIQQNFGESQENHGYVLWDIGSNSYEFFEIPNEYSYFTVKASNEGVKLPENLTSKPHIRIQYDEGIEENKISEIKEKISNKVDIQEIKEENINKSVKNSNQKELKINYGDIKNPDYQQKLIEEYINEFHPTYSDKTTFSELNKINEEINGEISNLEKNNIEWKPVIFTFSNMFSYGENNTIDFKNMNGLYGLFAPNKSGKSKLFDAISYCIFEKCSKTSEAGSVINSQATTFNCELQFYINNVLYTIERQGRKQKRGTISTTLDFYYTDENSGEKNSLSGQSKNETNKIIRSYLGVYENFEMTSLFSQKDKYNFIYASQKDKKEILSDFLDINIFRELFEISKSKFQFYKEQLKIYKDQDYPSQLNEIKTKIDEKSSEKENIKKQYDDVKEKRDALGNHINTLHQQIKEVEKTRDIETLEKEYEELGTKLREIDEEMNENAEKKKSVVAEYNEVQQELEKYAEEHIKKSREKLKIIKEELQELKKKIEIAQQDYNEKLEKTKKLQQVEYDPNCEYCMNNIFVLDAIETQKILSGKKKELDELQQKLEGKKEEYEQYKDAESDYEELIKLNNKEKEIKNRGLELKNRDHELDNKKVDIKGQMEENLEETTKHNKNKEIIEENNKIKAEIQEKEELYKQHNQNVEDVESELNSIKVEVKDLGRKRDDIQSKIDEFKQLEQNNKYYELYNNIMHRDSIPLYLINKNLPVIEDVCNNMLSDNFDINIKLEMEDNKIKSYIEYAENKYWPLELISGMEEFVVSTAIRMALVEISNIQKPNFFVIDEGFGTLDSQSFDKMNDILDVIKNRFEFVIVISHIEKMRDLVDKFIDLKMENGFSYINSLTFF